MVKSLLRIPSALAACLVAIALTPVGGQAQAYAPSRVRAVAQPVPGSYIVVLRDDLGPVDVDAVATDLAQRLDPPTASSTSWESDWPAAQATHPAGATAEPTLGRDPATATATVAPRLIFTATWVRTNATALTSLRRASRSNAQSTSRATTDPGRASPRRTQRFH